MKHFHYTALDSTLTQAQELARRHPAETLLVTAQTQTHGRGRSGRPWASPAGGAWFTIAWAVRPGLPPTHYAPVPLIAGLAVLEGVEPIVGAGHELRIKWPNDVLLNGRKVAGILCERVLLAPDDAGSNAADSEGGRPCLLIGIGINVNVDPAELGNDLRFPATSILSTVGRRTDVRPLIDACAERLAKRLDELERQGFSIGVRDMIQSHLAWVGQPITLTLGEEPVVGICRGLDATGRLELEIDAQVKSFDAGEVQGLSPQAG